MSTGGCVLVGRGHECVHRWMCPSGECVLVARGYECVHRWMCPSG